MTAQVTLSDESRRKLEELARQTGRTADDLASEAIEQYAAAIDSAASTVDNDATLPEWKRDLLRAAGMWKDRDDIPQLMTDLRREWDERVDRLWKEARQEETK